MKKLIFFIFILCNGCTKEAEPTGAEQWTSSEIVLTSEREYLNGYTDVEIGRAHV